MKHQHQLHLIQCVLINLKTSMKKTFTKIFITTLVVAGFAMGVSYVSAQNNTNGPADRTKYTKDLPIWTGSQVQEKDGGFLSKKHIGAPVGLFKKGIYLPGSNAKLRIGSADGAISLNPALFGDTSTEPVVIDMQKRTAPTDGTKFINGGQCTIATRLTTTGSQAYEFKTGNNLGNVIARQVQLTGGKPAANKILVSDTAGNATWAKAKVENGQVVFTTDEPSPVPAGQCAVPPVDLCPNIAGTQTTVPAGMALDTNGNCVTPPVVDLCTNIAGNQTTVPVGMVKDTPGDTPGNCTIPPVDLCSNIAGNQTTVPVGYEAEPSTGKCFTWVDYHGSVVKGNVGETCASFISRMTPYQPYTPVVNGKFRVSENSQKNGITGPVIATYPDKCIYGKTTSNNNNSYGVAVLGDLFTVPTASSNSNSYNYYFYPMVWVNGGTPWHVYALQYKSY